MKYSNDVILKLSTLMFNGEVLSKPKYTMCIAVQRLHDEHSSETLMNWVGNDSIANEIAAIFAHIMYDVKGN